MNGSNIKWFNRQEPALKFSDQQNKGDVSVVVLHKFDGKRRFCVSAYNTFREKYLKLHSGLQHFYEMIREGCRCRLYFDVEFNQTININSYGPIITDLLITYVNQCIAVQYGINCEKKQHNINKILNNNILQIISIINR